MQLVNCFKSNREITQPPNTHGYQTLQQKYSIKVNSFLICPMQSLVTVSVSDSLVTMFLLACFYINAIN